MEHSSRYQEVIQELKTRIPVLIEEALEYNASLRELGRKTGLSSTAIGSWKEGSSIPRIESILIIGSYLGLSPKETMLRLFENQNETEDYQSLLIKVKKLVRNDELSRSQAIELMQILIDFLKEDIH